MNHFYRFSISSLPLILLASTPAQAQKSYSISQHLQCVLGGAKILNIDHVVSVSAKCAGYKDWGSISAYSTVSAVIVQVGTGKTAKNFYLPTPGFTAADIPLNTKKGFDDYVLKHISALTGSKTNEMAITRAYLDPETEVYVDPLLDVPMIPVSVTSPSQKRQAALRAEAKAAKARKTAILKKHGLGEECAGQEESLDHVLSEATGDYQVRLEPTYSSTFQIDTVPFRLSIHKDGAESYFYAGAVPALLKIWNISRAEALQGVTLTLVKGKRK